MSMTPAMESIFANAQQNAASLIETATLAINAKVNTIEEAEKMIQDLSSEAVKFNELLTTIMNAMRQVESGDMQKEEAAGIIAPAVKELKDKCTALKISNAEAPGDDITEDEIAILRELIIGAKAAAEDRLVAIRLDDDDKVDPEVEAEVNTPEEAEEGFISNFIEKRQEAKVNKARIDTLWDSFKDKKAEDILNQFAKAAMPLFEGKDKTHVKTMVAEMIRADQKSSADYTGKLSAKDYIVKSISGYSMAIMPATIDGLGCNHILAPSSDTDGACFFFKNQICSIIINPIKKSELAPAKESYEVEIAEEAGFLAAKYVNTSETNTAKEIYSNAKKLYNLGSTEKAVQYMKQAKKLYEKALSSLMKSGKFETAERTYRVNNGTLRKNVTRTDSMTFAIARTHLETKVDRCTAYILQWSNKINNKSYNEILDRLKADRKEAETAHKLASESFYESEDTIMENYSEFMYACESYMDSLESELAADYAMESAIGDKAKATASEIGAKLRAGFTKLRKAVRIGDKKAADEARKEVEDAADDLDAAVAEDPEKKGLSTAAKIGIAAAATAVVAAGMYGAGKKLDKMSKDNDVKLNGVGKMLKGMANGVDSAAGRVKGGVDKARTGINNKITQVQHDHFVAKKGNGEKTWEKSQKAKAAKKAERSAKLSQFGDDIKHLPSTIKTGVQKGSDKVMNKLFIDRASMNEGAMEAFDIYEIIMESIAEELNYDVEVADESLCDFLDDYDC